MAINGSVTIGDTTRDLGDVDNAWLAQQITGVRRTTGSVCVVIRLGGEVDLTLAAGDCPRGRGGGRELTWDERRIVDEWTRLDLNDPDFAIGKLGQFFRFLERL